jgi:UMF1 family MFS transporter
MVGTRAVAAWVLYDLGNTIFSITIVSLYFPLWIVNDLGGRDGDYGLANSLSMGLMFVTAPLLGALSDQVPRRMPFLVISTLVCCAFTALLGSRDLLLALACFVVANYFYQAGLIFYDALLPTVSTPANRGRIGGLGVGLGYVGSFVGVGLGLTLLQADPGAKPLLFQLVALAFLLCAVPCFVWVREVRRSRPPFGWAAVRRAVAELVETLARLREAPALARFLVGRVFYADAANTILAFLGIYATNETGLSETQVQIVLLLSIAAAIAGGLATGHLVDWVGPKRTLDLVLALWAATLALTAAIAFLRLPGALFYLVGPLVGVALGGTWAADRPLMLRLAPPARLGQFYGLYALVGRFAAILGPLLWTAIVDWLGWGRPVAVTSLLVMIGLAALILRPVRAP